MKNVLWTLLILITINSWWVYALYVFPRETKGSDGINCVFILPLLFTSISFVFGIIYILNHWDDNAKN